MVEQGQGTQTWREGGNEGGREGGVSEFVFLLFE